MAIRSDVVVNWVASPRIITVLSPSVTITIQDLLDTCREIEDEPVNMVYSQLASAAGKENLGDGVKVGITLTLINAVLSFEARPGPTYTQCKVSGGNIVAVNSLNEDISPIYPTAFTQVLVTASSSATLATIGGSIPTTAEIATAVWNQPKSSHTTNGTLGKELATNKDIIAAVIAFK